MARQVRRRNAQLHVCSTAVAAQLGGTVVAAQQVCCTALATCGPALDLSMIRRVRSVGRCLRHTNRVPTNAPPTAYARCAAISSVGTPRSLPPGSEECFHSRANTASVCVRGASGPRSLMKLSWLRCCPTRRCHRIARGDGPLCRRRPSRRRHARHASRLRDHWFTSRASLPSEALELGQVATRHGRDLRPPPPPPLTAWRAPQRRTAPPS